MDKKLFVYNAQIKNNALHLTSCQLSHLHNPYLKTLHMFTL